MNIYFALIFISLNYYKMMWTTAIPFWVCCDLWDQIKNVFNLKMFSIRIPYRLNFNPIKSLIHSYRYQSCNYVKLILLLLLLLIFLAILYVWAKCFNFQKYTSFWRRIDTNALWHIILCCIKFKLNHYFILYQDLSIIINIFFKLNKKKCKLETYVICIIHLVSFLKTLSQMFQGKHNTYVQNRSYINLLLISRLSFNNN